MAKQQINSSQVKLTSRQKGWGYIQGNGLNVTSGTITFPTAFSTTPTTFIISTVGYKNATVPTSASDISGTDAFQFFNGAPTSTTAASFSLVGRDSGTTNGSGAYFIYSWIAEV